MRLLTNNATVHRAYSFDHILSPAFQYSITPFACNSRYILFVSVLKYPRCFILIILLNGVVPLIFLFPLLFLEAPISYHALVCVAFSTNLILFPLLILILASNVLCSSLQTHDRVFLQSLLIHQSLLKEGSLVDAINL